MNASNACFHATSRCYKQASAFFEGIHVHLLRAFPFTVLLSLFGQSTQNGSHRWLKDHDETVHGVITPNDIGTILSRRSPRLKAQNDIKAAALNLH